MSAALRAAYSQVRDFDEFDLVVECVAGYRDRNVDPPRNEKVRLEAKTEWDPVCSSGCQHQIELRVDGEGHEEGLPVRHATEVATPRPVEAENVAELETASIGASFVQVLLATVALHTASRRGPKRFVARAASCGVRVGSTPNGELRALFIVHRKAKIEYALTIPAYRELSRTAGTQHVGGVDVTSDTRAAVTRGLFGGSEVRERTMGGRVPYNPFARRSEAAEAPIRGTASIEQDLQFSIKVNGRELELMQARRRAIEAYLGMQRIVDAFADLVKKAPQIGWGFAYSFAFPSGSLALVQEREESNVPVERRLLPAPMSLSLQGELVFFKAWLEFSFGFHVERSWGTATIRAALRLGGEAKTSVNLAIPGGERKWEVETLVSAEVYLTAEVRVLTWSVSGRGSVNSGIKVSGKIYDGTPQAPTAPPTSPWKLEFKVKAVRGMASGHVSTFMATYPWSYELWPETDITPWGARPS